jgi:hypothetical protein
MPDTLLDVLFDYPWYVIEINRYVAEAPPGSGTLEITAKGWSVLEGNKDPDYLPL